MTALYDALNGWGPDYDYWLSLVRELGPETVCDLGCGTGQLTVLIAREGPKSVLGVDPDSSMLAVARQRKGHELVAWVEGYAADIPDASTDLISMTSHVSQVFLTDEDWLDALRHMRRALVPSGRLMFDMRNPLAQGWDEWNPATSRRQVESGDGPVEVWQEVTSVHDDLVTFDTTTQHMVTGETTTSTDTLRFRSEAGLRESLAACGFAIERMQGDWDGAPASDASRELLVLARVA